MARALEHCGAKVEITSDPHRVRRFDRVVLPGVGSFGDCINELVSLGMDAAISDFVANGRPLLGVCVGMQVLFTRGTEFGDHLGLGLIPGEVIAIPRTKTDGSHRRVPHVGWSALNLSRHNVPIMVGTVKNGAAYFVHSFQAAPTDPDVVVACSNYEGIEICAAVADGNVFGCQFHPEKSGPLGLRILSNFMRL